MRLTLIISSLRAGGAERVMTAIANYWAANNWEITILTLDDGTCPPFFKLHPHISHQPLKIAGDAKSVLGGLRNNLRRINVLRRAVAETKPECVVSFTDQTNVLTLIATKSLNIPTVVEEHIDVASNPLPAIWRLMRRVVYRRAAKIVVLTDRARIGLAPALQSRAVVISNPVQAPEVREFPRSSRTSRTIVSIGRLVHQKGFDILLRAFAINSPHHPEWNLTIIGEGPLRAELESLINSLGLEGRVKLLGQVINVDDYLGHADLFVLASRFEGFPMALCEALAIGLPVVAMDCPTGPREIIRDGIDGVLVPNEDVDALAAAMDRLMKDLGERQRLACRGPEIIERFGVQRVMPMWDELLAEVVQQKQ